MFVLRDAQYIYGDIVECSYCALYQVFQLLVSLYYIGHFCGLTHIGLRDVWWIILDNARVFINFIVRLEYLITISPGQINKQCIIGSQLCAIGMVILWPLYLLCLDKTIARDSFILLTLFFLFLHFLTSFQLLKRLALVRAELFNSNELNQSLIFGAVDQPIDDNPYVNISLFEHDTNLHEQNDLRIAQRLQQEERQRHSSNLRNEQDQIFSELEVDFLDQISETEPVIENEINNDNDNIEKDINNNNDNVKSYFDLPEAEEEEGAILLRIRSPIDGEMIERRFYIKEKLQKVYQFLDATADLPEHYIIYSTFPTIEYSDLNISVEETNLASGKKNLKGIIISPMLYLKEL